MSLNELFRNEMFCYSLISEGQPFVMSQGPLLPHHHTCGRVPYLDNRRPPQSVTLKNLRYSHTNELAEYHSLIDIKYRLFSFSSFISKQLAKTEARQQLLSTCHDKEATTQQLTMSECEQLDDESSVLEAEAFSVSADLKCAFCRRDAGRMCDSH